MDDFVLDQYCFNAAMSACEKSGRRCEPCGHRLLPVVTSGLDLEVSLVKNDKDK